MILEKEGRGLCEICLDTFAQTAFEDSDSCGGFIEANFLPNIEFENHIKIADADDFYLGVCTSDLV